MPLSQIQATVDTVANQQVSNQFGTQHFLLPKRCPTTRKSTRAPWNVRKGYPPIGLRHMVSQIVEDALRRVRIADIEEQASSPTDGYDARRC
jgi:hypothetical protein